MVEHRPVTAVTEFDRREEDGVEVDIVFPHELIETNMLGIEPPFPPFWCVVCGNAGVAYRCVELHYDKSVLW